jgi:parvulin-like peptidyl-prolyl isomerase
MGRRYGRWMSAGAGEPDEAGVFSGSVAMMRIGRARRGVAAMCGFVLAGGAAARAGDGDALAFVNGKPIARQDVINLLIESHGLEILQQLIVLEIAKQETASRGLKVTPADVEAEFRQSVDRIGAAAGEGPMDEAAKRQALASLLEQRGLSLAEFRLSMERNAHLRKLVEQSVAITDQTLREEYSRTYGEKVRVRHIQVAESSELNEVLNRLNRGDDFAVVARELSRNPESASRGGELPAFTFDEASIPPVLREAAFALKPGELSSPIRVEKWFHILKLEQRIAPENVRFEDVKPQVEQALRERVIPQEMNRKATELYRQAKIKVIDAKLRDQYEELQKKSAAAPG